MQPAMDADFFTRNFIGVFFIYGLAFFSMGLAIMLEASRASELNFARILRPLAWFGLIHGSHEWFEMFLLINAAQNPAFQPPEQVGLFRLMMLALSFIFLIAFGAGLIFGEIRTRTWWMVILAAVLIWSAGLAWIFLTQADQAREILSADVFTRYSLAIPGATLTACGLLIQRRRFIEMGMPGIGRDAALAALAFALYGGIGQLFVTPSTIFPSQYLNAVRFIAWFGFPVQVFRAAMAVLSAIFIIRSLRAFQMENQRQMDALRDSQQAERQRLDKLSAELLHRTVEAQEAERHRIANELHDEIGQTLTALGLGLRGLRKTIESNPPRALDQTMHLETVATGGLEGLQRLVSDLHPPHLDDLGLAAALRWYAGEIKTRFGLPVNVTVGSLARELAPNMRVVLFRIAQEAITNSVRHANASHVELGLWVTETEARLCMEDDGVGFDVRTILRASKDRPCWGLLGMMERAELIGGSLDLNSEPGKGTRVEVAVELPSEVDA